MKPYLRIVLWTLASLVLLGIVTVVSIPFMVDLNDFKAQIEAAVQENTGRKLTINGELELSFFPWLGITTGSMTLNNPDGVAIQPFAEIAASQIKVKLLPLLFKEVEVNEVVLKGLNLNLLKNSQGVNNWDDLAALIDNQENQAKNPLKLLEIAGLLIEDARIVWDDQQTGKKIEVKDFNLDSDKLVFNKPIEIKSDFIAQYFPLGVTETVSLDAALTLTEELDSFNFKKINLQTQTVGKFLPTGKLLASISGNALLDLHKQSLKLTSVDIKTNELTISAPTLTASLEKPFRVEAIIHIPNFDAAEFMQKQARIKLPRMVDEKALTWLAADFDLNADANHAKLENLEIQLDETTIKGFVQIKNFSNPAIKFDVALDKINVDRYLPPPEKQDDSQNLHTSPGSSMAANASLFPLETLKKLDLNGQLTIEDLKVNNLTMQGIKLIVEAQNGVVQSMQSVDRLYQGAYNGKIGLNVSGESPVLTVQQQLSHIQIEPLLTDFQGQSNFAGLVNLNVKLEATGNTEIALKSSLNGRLSFLNKDMLIRGFNLQKIIDNGKILLSNTSLPSENKKDQTFFSKVSGTALISNGFIYNNDLSATAAKMKVSGMGGINLVSQQLDYQVITVLLKKDPLAIARETSNLPVFINIGGTFNAPAYQVDLAAMGVGL
jgi:AsmA protein